MNQFEEERCHQAERTPLGHHPAYMIQRGSVAYGGNCKQKRDLQSSAITRYPPQA